ncbi:ubiquitin conjugating enzyme [Grosmannia clavigera kw1407]|uniref:Ubiquitin conjugating enzyme n=1 Tax=Grosmannia clavigera (strain kw1407 / UAMH 11150) TaxID=655863 RepID=F0XRH0_GROCL|nr:ubiquitin conjugating enzyme [Grosmannia clavigera kw1407]EFW99795.1 ubiquitin conjugating enzyme [Grosmannia clavigera kw1407]
MAAKPNSKSPTIRRILREAQELAAAPSADFAAAPLESDLFEWHFTLRGPPGTAYAAGQYHGRIVLPPTYPLRPPSFRFATPSGRFEANREICLSISGHHEETWQPAWGLRTALVALRAFMETDPAGQLGGLDASDATRRSLAAASPAFRCAVCGRSNAEILAENAAAEITSPSRASTEGTVQGEGSSATAPEIPPELKLVWRDELDAAGTTNTATPPTEAAVPPTEAAAPPTEAPTAPPVPAPRPFLRPTPTVPLPAGPRGLPLPPRRQSADMPVWVDRCIGALLVVLVAMLLRMALR